MRKWKNTIVDILTQILDTYGVMVSDNECKYLIIQEKPDRFVQIRAVCRFLERGVRGRVWQGIVDQCSQGRMQVIWGVLKKVRRAKRGANIFGVFCVKNQDFMQKSIFFLILGGCRMRPPPFESATGSGSDNNSTQMLLSENIVLLLAQIIYKSSTFVKNPA